jgi:excisionase family DNA binding protein
MDASTDRMLTYKQVADFLGVSHVCVRRWASDGRIPVVRLGPQCCRVRRSALEDWINSRSTEGASVRQA